MIMSRKVTLYPQGKDARYFDAPDGSLEEIVRHLASLPIKVYAVHVLVDGKHVGLSETNRTLVPPVEANVTLIQDCTSDHLYWKSWIVERQ